MSSPFGGFTPSKPEPEIMEAEFEEVAPELSPVVTPVSPEGVAEVLPVDGADPVLDTVQDIEAALDEEVVELRQSLGLISPYTLSKILGVHQDTLKGWRGEGKGPNYLKIGKRVWYSFTLVAEWLPSRRVRTEKSHDGTEKGLQQDEPAAEPEQPGSGSGDAAGQP